MDEALKSEKMKFTARTFQGLEPVLAKELDHIGATDIVISKRAVDFTGDMKLLYTANLMLRTAIKIIMPIHYFTASTEEELYNAVKAIEWEKYMTVNSTFMIDTAVNSEFFNHSKYVAYKAKDAIVDRFREKFGSRPSVNFENPTLYIDVRISTDQCCISFNASGAPLFKRGYRQDTNEAPINECLAAGLVLLSGWQGDKDLLDPMCGSGTILIEAAMYAMNMAPNISRNDFGFKTWNDFDPKLLMEVKRALRASKKALTCKIKGSDIDSKVISKAMVNISNAGLDEDISIRTKDFFTYEKQEKSVVLITNPPYHERMKSADINEMYATIGDLLKQHFINCEAWIISSNIDALKQVGLKPTIRIPLVNGKLECRFMQFEMYEGTRKYIPEQ
jgi:putative N6-adenine-specific DNA methylase